MSNERDRVISISLSEAEWQAFTARHPQPVHWLRDRIIGELQEARGAGVQDRAREDQRGAISNVV